MRPDSDLFLPDLTHHTLLSVTLFWARPEVIKPILGGGVVNYGHVKIAPIENVDRHLVKSFPPSF